MMQDWGIHWFRRDLRIAGNPALQECWHRVEGRVVGAFSFDKKFLSRPDFSANRFQFFLKTLQSLQCDLSRAGSELRFFDVGPAQAFQKIFAELKNNDLPLPKAVSWNRDYEPFARERDNRLKEFFQKQGIECIERRDHLLIEPHEIATQSGEAYKVYTPFSRKWMERMQEDFVRERLSPKTVGLGYFKQKKSEKIFSLRWERILAHDNKNLLEQYIKKNKKSVTVEIPPAGAKEAVGRLKNFAKKIERYSERRDFPALDGSSGLSVFLKNGSLTVPQIIAFLKLKPYSKKKSGRDVFLSELVWREFYYHVLYAYPHVVEKEFLPVYRRLRWENSKDFFKCWKEGTTGFPLVDAGMRELNLTGLMHNRVRMVVASFLTKDLLIDWRWGEQYFMEKLLDGDTAANNGGWQWAASTGCDAQPYFRIFNPWSQSKKFDPEGGYIKKYVPELRDIDPKKLHEPILDHKSYPRPVVEHSKQREKSLKLYKAARG